MKIIKILSVFLLVVTLVALSGSVSAYMRKQTDTMENTFVPAVVTCKVEEEFNGINKSSVAVKNTSTIEAYLRLRIITYWVDQDGKTLAKTSPSLNIDFVDDDWFEIDGVYYYKYPVQPEGVTKEFLATPIGLEYDNTDKSRQVVEIFAEAIQSLPASTVTSVWPGVKIYNNGHLYK